MTGCKDMGKKTLKNTPKMGFPHFCNHPRFFSKNWALSHLYPDGTLTSCKNLEKTNGWSPRYSKTDGPTDMGDYIRPLQITWEPN